MCGIKIAIHSFREMIKNKLKKHKEALVIGGTGFVGCHLVEFLIKKKFRVYSISRSKPKKNREIKNVKYLICDIAKKNLLKKKLKKLINLDYIINLGGEVDHKSFKNTYLSHYIGAKNLGEFFLNKKIKKFVQIGSSMEYGHSSSPQDENKTCKPKSKYGKAKYLATKHLIKLYLKYQFPAVILRPYQIYGPRQNSNRLIPFVIKNCIKNNQFPCSNGKQSRDFLFITDFIKAAYKALKSKNNTNGQIINIGYGKPYNLKKLINLIRNKLKFGKPDFGKIKLRKEENLVTYPTINKAKKILRWEPNIKFKNGIAKTIKSYKK